MVKPILLHQLSDSYAQQYQPVRECFGLRLYDWQLEQTPEESWRERHFHARNLLGPIGYQACATREEAEQILVQIFSRSA